MPLTRREFGATLLAAPSVARAADPPPRSSLGVLMYSFGIRARAEKDREFADPVRFIEFASDRGAGAIQLSLGTRTDKECTAVRAAAEKHGVAVEGIISPPADDRAVERFTAEVATAKACGATVV